MRSGPPKFVQISEQFVDSLRAFFDSLDLERTGFVSYENICHRWRQFPPRLTKLLPSNFLQHLAHTVPPNGFVSFERFLAGVRIALAEQQLQQQQNHSQSRQMPSKRSEMKRVQSEGGNLHINGLEDGEDLYGTRVSPANDIYGNYGNYVKIVQKPVMGIKAGGKPPPPNYGNGGGPSSSPIVDLNDNCKVQMRPKKHGNERNGTYSRSNGPSQFRPVSTNSVSSSSSMAEIRWRDSRLSNTSTPLGDTLITPTSNNNSNNNRHSSYLPEHSSQVAKHERLLEEEFDVIRRGFDISQKLTEWYEKRIASLEKRKEMLNKGMVALDSAVHEQKLNFVRAQVSEVNRRIQALMQSNEKGFPNHQNMIRNPVLPPSGAGSNGRISNSSTPESFSANSNNNNNNSPASTTWLHSQNQKLAEELEAKSRLIEQLQREKKLYELHNAATVGHHHHQQHPLQQHPQHANNNIHQAFYMRATPTAYVRPAMQNSAKGGMMNGNGILPPSPIKIPDTLL